MTRAPLGMLRALAIACLACAPHVHALAQAPTPPAPAGRSTGSAGSTSPSATGSDDALDRALRARRFEEADRLIEARIAAGDRDPVLLYNSACVLAQLGRLARAEERLMECIKAGFRDFDTMEADEDLEPVRASRTYEAIMEARERLERERPAGERPDRGRARRGGAPDPVAQWKRDHPEEFGDKAGYRYDSCDDGTIVYATFLDEASHERMKRNLDALGDHLLRAYFG